MANIATTNYKVTGTRKAVNDLWSTLQKMEVNSKNILLYQLAEHYVSYSRRLTICYGMNSLSHTESVNVAVRSIMCMMSVTSSLKR